MKSFFEIVTAANGETSICIETRRFSPRDCVCLLQSILIKKNAVNADLRYQDILSKAVNVLPKSGTESIKTIGDPIFNKLKLLFSRLISMEDGSPLPNVVWSEVDACLVDLNLSIKDAFKKNAFKIKMLHYVLVPFFQSCVTDTRTKAVVSRALTEASLAPILGQLLLNEYDDCGVHEPEIVPDSVGYIPAEKLDSSVVDAALEKISVIERIAMERNNVSNWNYLRDISYLKLLSTEDFYYLDPNLSPLNQVCRLSELSPDQLVQLVNIVMQSTVQTDDEDLTAKQRRVLQILAILRELYRKTTNVSLTDKELASIVLALNQSNFELQWQLDVHKTSPVALLLYTSLVCLRGDVVSIEQAERLLSLEGRDDPNRLFLKRLNIVYLEQLQRSGARLGVFHKQNLATPCRTYYFGSQALIFSDHPRLNCYLAHALCKMKQRVLQEFDIWYAILHTKSELSDVLRRYRETLLTRVERVWIQFVAQHMPCTDLQQIDCMIRQFQTDKLPAVWKISERDLMSLATQQKFTSIESQRLDFLCRELANQSARIVQPHTDRYAEGVYTLSEDELRGQYALQARLHYDLTYLSQQKRLEWIKKYLKHYLLHLHRLCPTVAKSPVPSEQFERFIAYLSSDSQLNANSAEGVAAMTLCVEIYHCIESILVWDNSDQTRTQIASLSKISSDNVLQALGAQLLSQLSWVSQTNSYYLWLEFNTIKQSAYKIYDIAQKIVVEPNNRKLLQAFIQILFEQQAILDSMWWYSPFAWLFGYADLRAVCSEILAKINQMVSLQQISQDVWQEAYESAYCSHIVQTVQNELQRVAPSANQVSAWQRFLQEFQTIKTQHTGFAMVYELEAYLQTQCHKFCIYQPSFFYGRYQIDPVVRLLRVVNKARCDIEKTTQHSVVAKRFLNKKAKQISAHISQVDDVSISAGYFTDYFFDVRTSSTQGDVRSQRFYRLNDFFAYTRKDPICEEALDTGWNMASV